MSPSVNAVIFVVLVLAQMQMQSVNALMGRRTGLTVLSTTRFTDKNSEFTLGLDGAIGPMKLVVDFPLLPRVSTLLITLLHLLTFASSIIHVHSCSSTITTQQNWFYDAEITYSTPLAFATDKHYCLDFRSRRVEGAFIYTPPAGICLILLCFSIELPMRLRSVCKVVTQRL
jgi:hypothetical protein